MSAISRVGLTGSMNRIHRRICRSDKWADQMRSQVLPWACEGIRLDGDVLEIGPGYGVTTHWLLERGAKLTAVEVDPGLAVDLRSEFGERVDIRTGDGAELPFADSALCTPTLAPAHSASTPPARVPPPDHPATQYSGGSPSSGSCKLR
jgi:SAM-dependent methyltransferase